MEEITESWKFPLNAWKFSLLRWKVPSRKKQNFEERISRLVKLVKIVSSNGRVLSQTVKFNRGKNTMKVHFHKFGKKKTGQSKR